MNNEKLTIKDMLDEIDAVRKTDDGLIRPPIEIENRLYSLSEKYNFQTDELEYHFNIGEWEVDLADTKKSMINYDIKTLIGRLELNIIRDDGETKTDYEKRRLEETENVKNELLDLYKEFKEHIRLNTPELEYKDIVDLFNETWDNLPISTEEYLEELARLMGDSSVIQNVIGESGNFKSTISMIDFNSLPNTLLMDDSTLSSIQRDSLKLGRDYLDGTVLYYNDAGDSGKMKENFLECYDSIYKKLYSEGFVNKSVTKKNSDNTLHINLATPKHGFKLKFNTVRPIFTQDYGQVKSRTEIITRKKLTPERLTELIDEDRFGTSNLSRKDPRIFKNTFEVYMTREIEPVQKGLISLIQEIIQTDNAHTLTQHIRLNKQMMYLYGDEWFDLFFFPNYVYEYKSDLDNAIILLKIIREVLIHGLLFNFENVHDLNLNNVNLVIARTKSSESHARKYMYDAFTVRAVRGIRRKWINEHVSEIPDLLHVLEDNELIKSVGQYRGSNVYIIVENEYIE